VAAGALVTARERRLREDMIYAAATLRAAAEHAPWFTRLEGGTKAVPIPYETLADVLRALEGATQDAA
jgi:hypothetical protein